MYKIVITFLVLSFSPVGFALDVPQFNSFGAAEAYGNSAPAPAPAPTPPPPKPTAEQQGAAVTSGEVSKAEKGATTDTGGGDTLLRSSANTLKNAQKGQSTAKLIESGLKAVALPFTAKCKAKNKVACKIAKILKGNGDKAKDSALSFDPVIDHAWQNTCEFSSYGCSGATPSNPVTDILQRGGILDQNKIDAADATIDRTLAEEGYSVDQNSGKIKTPDGSIIDPSNMNSLKSSLGPEGFADLMEQMKAVQARAIDQVNSVSDKKMDKALGLDGSSGGGMGAVAEVGGYGDAVGTGGKNTLNKKLNAVRNPAQQVKGLSKKLDGEPIGVAGDSLFEMMYRRYQLKKSQKTFIGSDVQ